MRLLEGGDLEPGIDVGIRAGRRKMMGCERDRLLQARKRVVPRCVDGSPRQFHEGVVGLDQRGDGELDLGPFEGRGRHLQALEAVWLTVAVVVVVEVENWQMNVVELEGLQTLRLREENAQLYLQLGREPTVLEQPDGNEKRLGWALVQKHLQASVGKRMVGIDHKAEWLLAQEQSGATVEEAADEIDQKSVGALVR